MVDDAGHSAKEPGIRQLLVEVGKFWSAINQADSAGGQGVFHPLEFLRHRLLLEDAWANDYTTLAYVPADRRVINRGGSLGRAHGDDYDYDCDYAPLPPAFPVPAYPPPSYTAYNDTKSRIPLAASRAVPSEAGCN